MTNYFTYTNEVLNTGGAVVNLDNFEKLRIWISTSEPLRKES